MSEMWGSDTWLTELALLLLAFLLSGLIGLERQFSQKSSGFRTHVLVGIGSATFTLVSGYGFATVLGTEVNLDPSRIAAQIVSGIGFLGAGVIFVRRDLVVGLTTAATIWVTAAVGMACGAGMVVLAIAVTALHILSLMLLAPLLRRLPTRDRRRVLQIRYRDGRGVLRSVLELTGEMGFAATVLSSSRAPENNDVIVHLRLHGRSPLHALLPVLNELDGLIGIRFASDLDESAD